jgi:hypothetical protein
VPLEPGRPATVHARVARRSRIALTRLFVGSLCSSLGASGRRGIRTPERVAPLAVFKTAAFVRSAILPASILAGHAPDDDRAAGLWTSHVDVPSAPLAHASCRAASAPGPDGDSRACRERVRTFTASTDC